MGEVFTDNEKKVVSKIVDADDDAKKRGYPGAAAMREAMARRRRIRIAGTEARQVYARIDWGRWLADCPFCNGSELVSKAEGLFFCFSCEMAGNGGRAVEVLFPEGVDRIEAGLVNERVSYQNWRYEVDGGVYRGVREKGGE
ncbi:MAG: hypothetical protein BWY79_01544 [Actinobacteria bacterium ADurb.Bin444]|nr:MAG: hypothetical protein BWY79_01544 [Actinobacteria bacterium ADurb.Bin444]